MYLCMSRLSTDNECYLLLLHPQTGTAYLDNCANQQPPRSFEMLAGTSQPPGLRQWRTVYGIGPYELETFTISETTSHASLMLQDTKHSHLCRACRLQDEGHAMRSRKKHCMRLPRCGLKLEARREWERDEGCAWLLARVLQQ